MTQLADPPPLATPTGAGAPAPARRGARLRRRRADRRPEPDPTPAEAPVPEQAFTGDLVVLRRLARVRRGTVVAMFTADQRPMLREPGELLLPDRNPFRHRISVMPISTDTVRLQVRVVDLRTLDGLRLDALELTVGVQLQSRPDRLLELAVKHGPQLGHFLNDQVREGMENTARAGIKMSTRTELQEVGVAELLRQRWLPRTLLGLLEIVDFEVTGEQWAPPSVVRRRHTATPVPTGAAPAEAVGSAQRRPSVENADLHTDVRLLAAWRRRLPALPRGIASGRHDDTACLIAVVDAEPPAFEGRQLWEDFAGLLEDRHLQLLLCRGTTYEEIVRSWFAQLGLPVRLEVQLRVTVSRERIDLRLPAELEAETDRSGPNGAAVAALRRLLSGRTVSVGYDERS